MEIKNKKCPKCRSNMDEDICPKCGYDGLLDKENNKSEFGDGLTYCLGMFLAHAEKDLDGKFRGQLWFNAASDHLYGMNIPGNFPKELKDRLTKFRNDVLDKGHGSGMMKQFKEKDIQASLEEAKDLLLSIDRLFGIESNKGEYT
jgi:hypothetical protein